MNIFILKRPLLIGQFEKSKSNESNDISKKFTSKFKRKRYIYNFRFYVLGDSFA